MGDEEEEKKRNGRGIWEEGGRKEGRERKRRLKEGDVEKNRRERSGCRERGIMAIEKGRRVVEGEEE